MKYLAYFFAAGLLFSALGCDSYEPRLETPLWQHKVHRKQNKLRRRGLAIEKKGEEPEYHELSPFPPTMNWFASAKIMERTPRRILVMPATNPWNNPDVTRTVTRILTRELLKGGFSDVLSLPDMRPENTWTQWPWSRWPDPIRAGRIKYPELAEAAERFQAQAVLYSQVTIYKQTEPPDFGIKAMLVNIGPPPCCEVVWVVDAVFDAGDTEIWERSLQYYNQRTAKHWRKHNPPKYEPHGGTRYFGHRLMLVSMDRYLEYCSYEIVKNLRIASRGLLWPHYQYERKESPKKSIPVRSLDEEDEQVADSKPKKRRSIFWWRNKDSGGGGSKKQEYPPYLLREYVPDKPAATEGPTPAPQSSATSGSSAQTVSETGP